MLELGPVFPNGIAFDREGTSIDPSASLDQHDEDRRAADEARWDAKWGKGPGSSTDD